MEAIETLKFLNVSSYTAGNGSLYDSLLVT